MAPVRSLLAWFYEETFRWGLLEHRPSRARSRAAHACRIQHARRPSGPHLAARVGPDLAHRRVQMAQFGDRMTLTYYFAPIRNRPAIGRPTRSATILPMSVTRFFAMLAPDSCHHQDCFSKFRLDPTQPVDYLLTRRAGCGHPSRQAPLTGGAARHA